MRPFIINIKCNKVRITVIIINSALKEVFIFQKRYKGNENYLLKWAKYWNSYYFIVTTEKSMFI